MTLMTNNDVNDNNDAATYTTRFRHNYSYINIKKDTFAFNVFQKHRS